MGKMPTRSWARAGWGVAAAAILGLSSAPFLPPFADDPVATALEIGLSLAGGMSIVHPRAGAGTLVACCVAVVILLPGALGLSVLAFALGTAALFASGSVAFGAGSGLLYYAVLLGLSLSQARSTAEVLEAVGFWTIVFGLATAAGVGVRRVQVIRQRESEAHAKAIRDERERMARHLHDTIVRATDRAVRRAEMAHSRGDADERTLHDLEFIAETCRAAVADQRRLLQVLHSDDGLATLCGPAPRPAVVLEAALAALRSDGFDARLRCDDNLASVDETGAQAFADAMQEAVANVIAHADRSQPVTVVAVSNGPVLRCGIRNRILRPDSPSGRNGHLGLGIAHQRLRQVGGSLLSRPKGAAWETLVTVPAEGAVATGKGNSHD
ncbi:hypothetical protein [Raineyella sp. W15-4]|uniref:sensor histidine kinase n=1 Tax=Raineyella sp. W15-4 TaxID=3081651 RepID=UPI002955A428|nr:hypothetical protein [Raineyella sp. W15-4]WOQ15455.1 hypothetical protein R0145_09320 [Raineyella sp. W15-4]